MGGEAGKHGGEVGKHGGEVNTGPRNADTVMQRGYPVVKGFIF